MSHFLIFNSSKPGKPRKTINEQKVLALEREKKALQACQSQSQTQRPLSGPDQSQADLTLGSAAEINLDQLRNKGNEATQVIFNAKKKTLIRNLIR